MRTDLDALEPGVVDLLMAQGYFLTDFMVKLTMADLVFEGRESHKWYEPDLAPDWGRRTQPCRRRTRTASRWQSS